MAKARRIIFYTLGTIAALFVILVIVRMVHLYNLENTNEQVAKIHATKLTLDDVLGVNLPPYPGEEADKTIAGVDANANGIRDDVELAIFKEYPDSARTRAVLLQYALVVQMQMVQPVTTSEIATSIAEKESQGYSCIGSIVPRGDDDLEKIDAYISFVEDKQFDTNIRKERRDIFSKNVGSFELQSGCDLDIVTLNN